MRRRTLPMILALAAMLLVLGAAVAGAEPLVAETWAEAEELAAKHDKPILIDFFTEW